MISNFFVGVWAFIRPYKWWWAGGAGGVVVAGAVAGVVMFGGFFGPSGTAICTAALTHAKAFGVVPYDASLSNHDAKKTKIDKRRQCEASDGDTPDDHYVMTVDLKCDKIPADKDGTYDKDGKCVELYGVARADGLSTYQVRQVPNDADDTPAQAAAALPAVDAAPAGASDANAPETLDTEDAPPASGQGAPPPDQQPQQQ